MGKEVLKIGCLSARAAILLAQVQPGLAPAGWPNARGGHNSHFKKLLEYCPRHSRQRNILTQ